MKNIIFTTFFVILLQESHQNLMWKIVISSNLNPLLKLYFYSPILTNNNMLLKIYCENIVVEFLNCHFFFFYILFFLSFFLSIIHTFFFSSWFFSTTHVYPYIPFLSLFFLHFPLSRTSLSLSFSISLSTFFFPTHYLAFSVIRNGERGRERKIRWVRWLCFAAAARLPPHYRLSSSPPPGWVRSACSFFSFLFSFFSYLLVLIQLYFKNWIVFCVLRLDYMRNRENERKKKIRRRKRKNWYNSSCDNFLSRKIDLEFLQCSLN